MHESGGSGQIRLLNSNYHADRGFLDNATRFVAYAELHVPNNRRFSRLLARKIKADRCRFFGRLEVAFHLAVLQLWKRDSFGYVCER